MRGGLRDACGEQGGNKEQCFEVCHGDYLVK
jgi:hypothetical protein